MKKKKHELPRKESNKNAPRERKRSTERRGKKDYESVKKKEDA